MITKVFYENNRTIKIILNDDDNVIIEIYRFDEDNQQLTVSFDYYDYDFYLVIENYKKNLIKF